MTKDCPFGVRYFMSTKIGTRAEKCIPNNFRYGISRDCTFDNYGGHFLKCPPCYLSEVGYVLSIFYCLCVRYELEVNLCKLWV